MPGAEARPARSATRSRDGFTLIEVLVAFIVLALGTLVVQRAVMTSVSTTERADGRLRADMVVRTLMTAPLSPGSGGPAPSSGVMDGLSWTLRFEPLRLPFPTAADAAGKVPAWTPVRMIVTVALPERQGFLAGGGTVRIDTVRLVKAPPA